MQIFVDIILVTDLEASRSLLKYYGVNYKLSLLKVLFRKLGLSPLAIDDDTTIRMKTLSRDETTILARKKHKTGGNFTRLTWPTHWRSELLLGRSIHSCGDQRSPH